MSGKSRWVVFEQDGVTVAFVRAPVPPAVIARMMDGTFSSARVVDVVDHWEISGSICDPAVDDDEAKP